MARYGCHDLQLGDHDPDPAKSRVARWGGVNNAVANQCASPATTPSAAGAPGTPGAVSTLTVPAHVQQLQDDLATLGFSLVGAADGAFGLQVQMAVREFQIYAKMNFVARVKAAAPAAMKVGAHIAANQGAGAAGVGTAKLSPYVDSLEQIANDQIYTGPVSGVVNSATRAAIEHWIASDFRCPVIVEAWNMSGNTRNTLNHGNLYLKDDINSNGPRVFARDFTDHYTFPATRSSTDMIVVGDHRVFLGTSGPTSTPPNQTWTEAEMMPEDFLGAGVTYTVLDAEANPPAVAGALPAAAVLNRYSTYRVVRAASEVECQGFFDCINANDNAFESLGPCHWTLAIDDGTTPTTLGELPGFFSYLRQIDPAAFNTALGFFGFQAADVWGVAPNDGAALFNQGQVKYVGEVQAQTETAFANVPRNNDSLNYYRCWHWFYRLLMAGRTVAGYRQRMWDLARARLRDILRVPWGATLGVPAGVTPTIGHVFTSEAALAILLRWHIRFPADVASRVAATPTVPAHTQTTSRIRGAIAQAQALAPTLSFTTDPATWTDAHEDALVNGLIAQVAARGNSNLTTTFSTVTAWPAYPGRAGLRYRLAAPAFNVLALSRKRNSLQLFSTGIPTAQSL